MARLSRFIRENSAQILTEWEAFARSLPIGGTMDVEALRDHAEQMLAVIARDLDTHQTDAQQDDKARGQDDADRRSTITAAQEHGAGRADSGFSVSQMVAEFRALRASVTRLWLTAEAEWTPADLQDLVRFNEAIDQAIAESITRYSGDLAESKERFLAILGHDLRTPLGAIITATKFMLDTGELTEPHLTLVGRVATSARRMNRMVEDLVEFTRTRFGDSIPVVRTELDLRKVIVDVASEVGATYPQSSVHVEITGDLRGKWDGERLAQALTNLVSNAVQHGASTPITLLARGLPHEVQVCIHNDGPPIAQAHHAGLFEAMKNARGDGPRDKQHLGLGLYIVEKIVTAHGGSIDVTSSAGQGTTFMVHLPRAA